MRNQKRRGDVIKDWLRRRGKKEKKNKVIKHCHFNPNHYVDHDPLGVDHDSGWWRRSSWMNV